jgi:hypothetical protein
MPEAADELGSWEAHTQAGLDGWGAIGSDGERRLWLEAAAQQEVGQGAVALRLLRGREDGPEHLLRAPGITIGGYEERVGVVAPAPGQGPPEVAVKAIHLNLIGAAGDGAERREAETGQPAHGRAPAQVDAAALKAVAQMPDANAFAQALDDLKPDVPPVAAARLEDGEAQWHVGTTEAA